MTTLCNMFDLFFCFDLVTVIKLVVTVRCNLAPSRGLGHGCVFRVPLPGKYSLMLILLLSKKTGKSRNNQCFLSIFFLLFLFVIWQEWDNLFLDFPKEIPRTTFIYRSNKKCMKWKSRRQN